MSLTFLSARLEEAKADFDLADELRDRRPSAAILLTHQGAGQALQAAASYWGVILERPGTLRRWAEELRQAGFFGGLDRDMTGGLRSLEQSTSELRFPYAGHPGDLEKAALAASQDARRLLDGLRRAVEAREGPLRLLLDVAETHAQRLAADRARTEPQATPAGQVELAHEAIDAALGALWTKVRQTHDITAHAFDVLDRWTGFRDSGALPEVAPEMDGEMRNLRHWRFRAERERRTDLDREPMSSRISARAAKLAADVVGLARTYLAGDLAPLAIPEPRPWAEVQAEEWDPLAPSHDPTRDQHLPAFPIRGADWSNRRPAASKDPAP